MIEHRHRMINRRLRPEQFREFDEEAPRFGVDFHVTDQGGVRLLRAQFADNGFDLFALRFESRQVFRLRLRGPPLCPR